MNEKELMKEWAKIPDKMKENYRLRFNSINDKCIDIHQTSPNSNDVYISIRNPKIEENKFTIDIKNKYMRVMLWKEISHVHVTVYGD